MLNNNVNASTTFNDNHLSKWVMNEATLYTVRHFCDTVSIYAKPDTVKNYRRIICSFYKFIEKDYSEVMPGDVARWVSYLQSNRKGKTTSLYVTVIKSYLTDYLPQINAKRIRTMKAHAEHPSDIFGADEYVLMLSLIKADSRDGVRDNLIIRMLYDTGARICEVHDLIQKKRYNKDRSVFINTAKTNDKRLIMWTADTDVFLRTWESFNQDLVSIRQCQRIVKKYALMAGIEKKITPHSFRHTKAHKILDNGGSVKDVAEVLGHGSFITSEHYLREYEQARLVRQEKWL